MCRGRPLLYLEPVPPTQVEEAESRVLLALSPAHSSLGYPLRAAGSDAASLAGSGEARGQEAGKLRGSRALCKLGFTQCHHLSQLDGHSRGHANAREPYPSPAQLPFP